MRTIIIGDVHGCDKALCSILEKSQPAAEDRIVMLGDLFDRGPDSFEVFQAVKKLADDMGERFVLLRGNHEDYLLAPKLTPIQRMIWERVGRAATVRSFRARGAQMGDAIPWLGEHCQLFWRGEGIQCVHAGLMVDPIEVNDTRTMIHDHEITLRNAYVGPLTVVGHIALANPMWFVGDRKTVERLPYGELLPLPERGILCIDTGCGKGGKLTAMVVEDGRYVLIEDGPGEKTQRT